MANYPPQNPLFLLLEKVVRKDAWLAEGGESGVRDGGKKKAEERMVGEGGEKGWWAGG
jgi:hypothetical protein